MLSKAELLDGKVFYSLAEAEVVIESWRQHYHVSRPHSALGNRALAPEVILWPARPAAHALAPTPVIHQLPTWPTAGAGHDPEGRLIAIAKAADRLIAHDKPSDSIG